jgi:YidC/Oxa1 family membrane protein insertase
MQKAQRIMLMVLPIVFIPFILNFPSGLMIYWLTTNLWTTGQGVVTRRMMPRPDPTALKKTSRTPPKEEPTPTSKRKGVPPGRDGTAPPVAGPPRRVKRKRSGGGKRR